MRVSNKDTEELMTIIRFDCYLHFIQSQVAIPVSLRHYPTNYEFPKVQRDVRRNVSASIQWQLQQLVKSLLQSSMVSPLSYRSLQENEPAEPSFRSKLTLAPHPSFHCLRPHLYTHPFKVPCPQIETVLHLPYKSP